MDIVLDVVDIAHEYIIYQSIMPVTPISNRKTMLSKRLL
jgi:hypothetical protein